jgi:hypothetical protein
MQPLHLPVIIEVQLAVDDLPGGRIYGRGVALASIGSVPAILRGVAFRRFRKGVAMLGRIEMPDRPLETRSGPATQRI